MFDSGACPECGVAFDRYDPHLGLDHCPDCDRWFDGETVFARPTADGEYEYCR